MAAAVTMKNFQSNKLFVKRLLWEYCCKRGHKNSRFVTVSTIRKQQVSEIVEVKKRLNWENLYLFGPILQDDHDEAKSNPVTKRRQIRTEVKLGNISNVEKDLSKETIALSKVFNEISENKTTTLPSLYPFTIDSFGNKQYMKSRAADILLDASERDLRNEDLQIPSVSSILHKIMSESDLLNERQAIVSTISQFGWQQFNKHKKELHEINTELRRCLELFFNPQQEDIRLPENIAQYWNSMLPFLYTLTDVKVNQHVIHPYLYYSGVADCVAVWQNQVVLIEILLPFGNTSVTKNIKDAPIRAAAYAGALNADTTNSRQITEVLLICPSPNQSLAEVHNIEMDKAMAYWNLWLQKLRTYWEMRCENSMDIYTNVSYK